MFIYTIASVVVYADPSDFEQAQAQLQHMQEEFELLQASDADPNIIQQARTELMETAQEVEQIYEKEMDQIHPGFQDLSIYKRAIISLIKTPQGHQALPSLLEEAKIFLKAHPALAELELGQSFINLHHRAEIFSHTRSTLEDCSGNDNEQSFTKAINQALSTDALLESPGCNRQLAQLGEFGDGLQNLVKNYINLEMYQRAGQVLDLHIDNGHDRTDMAYAMAIAEQEAAGLWGPEQDRFFSEDYYQANEDLMHRHRLDYERRNLLYDARVRIDQAMSSKDETVLEEMFGNLMAGETVQDLLNRISDWEDAIGTHIDSAQFQDLKRRERDRLLRLYPRCCLWPQHIPGPAFTTEEQLLIPELDRSRTRMQALSSKMLEIRAQIPPYRNPPGEHLESSGIHHGYGFSHPQMAREMGFWEEHSLANSNFYVAESDDKQHRRSQTRANLLEVLGHRVYQNAAQAYLNMQHLYQNPGSMELAKIRLELDRNVRGLDFPSAIANYQPTQSGINRPVNFTASEVKREATEQIKRCIQLLKQASSVEQIYVPASETTISNFFDIMSSNQAFRSGYEHYQQTYYSLINEDPQPSPEGVTHYCRLLATKTFREQGQAYLRQYPKDASTFENMFSTEHYQETPDESGYQIYPYDPDLVTGDLVDQAINETQQILTDQMKRANDLEVNAKTMGDENFFSVDVQSSLRDLITQNPLAVSEVLMEHPEFVYEICETIIQLAQQSQNQQQMDQSAEVASLVGGSALAGAGLITLLSGGSALPLVVAGGVIGIAEGSYYGGRSVQISNASQDLRAAFINGNFDISGITRAQELEWEGFDQSERALISFLLNTFAPVAFRPLTLMARTGIQAIRIATTHGPRVAARIFSTLTTLAQQAGGKFGELIAKLRASFKTDRELGEFLSYLANLQADDQARIMTELLGNMTPANIRLINTRVIHQALITRASIPSVLEKNLILAKLQLLSAESEYGPALMRILVDMSPEQLQLSLRQLSAAENISAFAENLINQLVRSWMRSPDVLGKIQSIMNKIQEHLAKEGFKFDQADIMFRLNPLLTTLTPNFAEFAQATRVLVRSMNDPQIITAYINDYFSRMGRAMILDSSTNARRLFYQGQISGRSGLRSIFQTAREEGTPLLNQDSIFRGVLKRGEASTMQRIGQSGGLFRDSLFDGLDSRVFSNHMVFGSHGVQRDFVEFIFKKARANPRLFSLWQNNTEFGSALEGQWNATGYFQAMADLPGQHGTQIWDIIMDNGQVLMHSPEQFVPISRELGFANEVIDDIFRMKNMDQKTLEQLNQMASEGNRAARWRLNRLAQYDQLVQLLEEDSTTFFAQIQAKAEMEPLSIAERLALRYHRGAPNLSSFDRKNLLRQVKDMILKATYVFPGTSEKNVFLMPEEAAALRRIGGLKLN